MSRKVKKGKKRHTATSFYLLNFEYLIKITCLVVTMSLQTLWQGGKGNPARTWRGGRIKPTGFNSSLARTSSLDFRTELARTSGMGFRAKMARIPGMGFNLLMARMAFLGFNPSLGSHFYS